MTIPLSFLALAEKVLREEQKPLSAEEIWAVAQSKGYNALVGSQGKTPVNTLSSRLYTDIKDKQDRSTFVKAETRPTRFYLRDLFSANGQATAFTAPVALPPSKPAYLEKDLHPFLVYYAHHYLNAHLKTIRHSLSNKKEFGEWVHPDIIGCTFPIDEWKKEVLDFSTVMGSTPVRIFSFELKRELSFSNLREAFFQTVSNSSWANESYLVAAAISEDSEFRDELKRLSSSFGIGVIYLDIEDPDATDILFPAKFREYLDWDAINKLTMNPDFCEFLKRVKTDISSQEIRKELYDPVLPPEKLLTLIAQA